MNTGKQFSDSAMGATAFSSKEITTETIHKFFDEIFEQLEQDKKDMLTGMASEEKQEYFGKLMKGDADAVADLTYFGLARRSLQAMLSEYIGLITKSKNEGCLPKELAFSFKPSSMNIFAVVKDNDDDTARKLILAEASLIPKYQQKGFRIHTRIVEDSDGISIPVGYSKFPIK